MNKYLGKPIKKNDILINEKTKKIWNLEENKNFNEYILYNKTYKLRNEFNNDKALLYIFLIDKYISYLANYINNNKDLCIKKKCLHESYIFLHTPYLLQEIPKNDYFIGLNKPKEICWKKKNCPLKTMLDNDFLAKYRVIMLQLRDNNGRLIKWYGKNGIKNLILHELSHTFCNHITYRENGKWITKNKKKIYNQGNHEKEDFEKCEKFLHIVAFNCKKCKKLDKELINF